MPKAQYENTEPNSPFKVIKTYTGEANWLFGPHVETESLYGTSIKIRKEKVAEFLNKYCGNDGSVRVISQNVEKSLMKDFINVLRFEDDKYIYTGSSFLKIPKIFKKINKNIQSVNEVKKSQYAKNLSVKEQLMQKKQILSKAISAAKSKSVLENKKLLVILIEDHFERKSLLMQMMALNISQKYGINNIILEETDAILERMLQEDNLEGGSNATVIVSEASKRNMKIIAGVHDVTTGTMVRMTNMKNSSLKFYEDTLVVIGINNLKDFLEDETITSWYNIAAFNTANISKSQYNALASISSLQKSLLEYAYNAKNAIQLNIEGKIPGTIMEILNTAKSLTGIVQRKPNNIQKHDIIRNTAGLVMATTADLQAN